MVAVWLHRYRLAGMANNQNGFDPVRFFKCGVDIGFQRNRLATTYRAIGTNNEAAGAILNAPSDCLRRKAAKDDAVHSANARASKHGHRTFDAHGHVDRNPVALARA